MSKIAAILTGDLIGSTRTSPERVEDCMRRIAACSAELDTDTRFTRYRGDGWQLRLETPGNCLWACLYLHATLRAARAVPTRIAVGLGKEWPSDASDLSTAIGPAYTESGHALDRMKPGQTFAVAGEGVDKFRELAFAFADDYASRWSIEQAEAMRLALSPEMPTQGSMATTLGISRQAVGSRLKAAGHDLLENTHMAFFRAYATDGLG